MSTEWNFGMTFKFSNYGLIIIPQATIHFLFIPVLFLMQGYINMTRCQWMIFILIINIVLNHRYSYQYSLNVAIYFCAFSNFWYCDVDHIYHSTPHEIANNGRHSFCSAVAVRTLEPPPTQRYTSFAPSGSTWQLLKTFQAGNLAIETPPVNC